MRLVPLQLFQVLHSIVFWLKCRSVSKGHTGARWSCGTPSERDYFHRAMAEVRGHHSLQTEPQVVWWSNMYTFEVESLQQHDTVSTRTVTMGLAASHAGNDSFLLLLHSCPAVTQSPWKLSPHLRHSPGRLMTASSRLYQVKIKWSTAMKYSSWLRELH